MSEERNTDAFGEGAGGVERLRMPELQEHIRISSRLIHEINTLRVFYDSVTEAVSAARRGYPAGSERYEEIGATVDHLYPVFRPHAD